MLSALLRKLFNSLFICSEEYQLTETTVIVFSFFTESILMITFEVY